MNPLIKYIFILLFLSTQTVAAPTKVGNGDDGTDLEGFQLITKGKLIQSQKLATTLLKQLNIQGIPGLGSLIPELENNKIYITNKNVSAERLEEMGAYHSGLEGLVYARTMPRPYAPTRFFPVANKLSMKQLISLHIHEALHRALPENINKNEKIVTKITLAITSPESSFDQVKQAVSNVAPQLLNLYNKETSKNLPQKHSRVNMPSTFGLSVTTFKQPKDTITKAFSLPINQMYKLSSHLYPFGSKLSALGIGIDITYLTTDSASLMGPLGLSARMLLWTVKKFDIEGYLQYNMNTLSNEEIQNSLLGRDVFKVGISMNKETKTSYLQNDLEHTSRSKVEEKIGNIDYVYNFEAITTIRIRAGYKGIKKMKIGILAEMLLSKDPEVKTLDSAVFSSGNERNRIFNVGSEFSYNFDSFIIEGYGKILLDSSAGSDLDQMGDLVGVGIGQGSMGINFKLIL